MGGEWILWEGEEKKEDKEGTDEGMCEEPKAAEGGWGGKEEEHQADSKVTHEKSEEELNKAQRGREGERTGRVC